MTIDIDGLWHLTVVRAHGLRYMRPEKSWRPIIKLEVDSHNTYETVLGSDGQHINLKETFTFDQASVESILDIRVYQQSQTKKKSKRKKEVAAVTGLALGQLIKKQELERKIELRLQCQTQNKPNCASRGKPQNGATIVLRIRPPPSYASSSRLQQEHEQYASYASDSDLSDTLNAPPSPIGPITPPPEPENDIATEGLRRRKRVKGYAIYSDEEPFSSGGEEDERPRISFADFAEKDLPINFEDEEQELDPPLPVLKSYGLIRAVESVNTWIAASLLPQYTQHITVEPASMNPAERVVSAFTLYSELKHADRESQYEPIFERLQREWQYVGGLLAALAAVNAAVFAISTDSLFQIQPYALSAIAGSSAASGFGMAIDAWFLFRYTWVNLNTFIYRAQDVYGSYFFFALSARMPAMCMLFSATALMAFLGIVAFEVWPEGVVVVCFIVGIMMSLQFLVYGVHWCALKIAVGGKAGKKGVAMVVRKMTSSTVEV